MEPIRIHQFVKNYIPPAFRLIYVLATFNLLLGFIFLSINKLTTNYSGVNYLPTIWIYCMPLIAVLVILAFYIDKQAPRIAFFTQTYGTYFYVFIALATLTNGVQYTPFATIDQPLLSFDQWIGFNTPALMHWTYAHTHFPAVLNAIYESIGYQMFLVPLLLALLLQRKSITEYFSIALITYTIGTLIYYFFPSEGPAMALQSPYFTFSEHLTSLKFFDVHHHVPIHTLDGGMIAFPSFHVTWVLILTYACRQQWWFVLPIGLLNLCVIASTLMLGWHYLADVIGSVIIFGVAVFLSRITSQP